MSRVYNMAVKLNGNRYAGRANNLANIGNALAAAQLSSVNQNLRAQQASAQRAMEHASREAELNRQWQERMANTQYQRAMADMKKAGLNPILAYQQGGNSVPSGSSAGGYTISGAQGNVNGLTRALMRAPSIFGAVQEIATSGYTRAKTNNEVKGITKFVQNATATIRYIINEITKPEADVIAGAQK